MKILQRLLARFGYVRLADHGLVLTPYGVVRANEHWAQQEGAQLAPPSPPPRFGQASPAPGLIEKLGQGVTPMAMRGDETPAELRRLDESGDGSTTVAQPLSDFRPSPATAEHELTPKWVQRVAAPTVVVDATPMAQQMLVDDDEKTLFSPPPLEAPSTPQP